MEKYEGKNENIYMSKEARARLYRLVKLTGLPKAQIVARGLKLVEESLNGGNER